MYEKIKPSETSLNVNTSYIGESIEEKIQRVINNKEPISDHADIIYTERKDGVMPEYDIRTDRFEIAIDAMDKVSKAYTAKRNERITLGEQAKKGMKKEDSGAKPIQGTENTTTV